MFQGVMAGDMPLIGLGAEPKNMPVAGMEKAKVNQRLDFRTNEYMPKFKAIKQLNKAISLTYVLQH